MRSIRCKQKPKPKKNQHIEQLRENLVKEKRVAPGQDIETKDRLLFIHRHTPQQ